jgi:hypothetical protein
MSKYEQTDSAMNENLLDEEMEEDASTESIFQISRTEPRRTFSSSPKSIGERRCPIMAVGASRSEACTLRSFDGSFSLCTSQFPHERLDRLDKWRLQGSQ